MYNLSLIEKNCGYTFKNKALLKKALTLSSYDGEFNNQSMECLGDALLALIVAKKYYLEGKTEGEITQKKQQLLSDEALRPVSVKLELDKALIKDKGDTANKKAIPSAYEAVCAAIYLDGGFEEAERFALSTLAPVAVDENCVGALQELLQERGRPLPQYKKISLGTPKQPVHRVEVEVEGKLFFAEDVSFAAAKKTVARQALQYMKENNI